MNSESFSAYKHSGKFGPHGPVLSVLAAAVIGFPLGFVYAYGIKWIPIVYVNFLLTLGYGFVFGFVTGALMKFGRVRNSGVALLTGVIVGLVGLYFAWNAHLHAEFDREPLLCGFEDLRAGMAKLYEEGSWSLRGNRNITGIPLVIVWVVEAGIIVGFAAILAYGGIAEVPYCEQTGHWLDQEKKIDTLEMFTDPEQLAALKAGNLGPLAKARPRPPDAAAFTRLTLKHSPKCEVFCTVRLENVTIAFDSDGDRKEKAQPLTGGDLKLPASMHGLIAKFENFQAPPIQTRVV